MPDTSHLNINGFDKNSQNINRNGRPRRPFSEIIKDFGELEHLTYELEITARDKDTKQIQTKTLKGNINSKDDKTLNELVVAILYQRAIGGDLKAIQDLMDRQEGKPIQKIEQKNENTNTEIIIERNIIKLGDIES